MSLLHLFELVIKATRARKELLEHKAQSALKVLKEFKVLKESRVLRVLRVMLAPKERKGSKVYKEQLVLRDL
jgi:hypothetical protein